MYISIHIFFFYMYMYMYMIANLKVHGSDLFHKRGGSRKIRESHRCFSLLFLRNIAVCRYLGMKIHSQIYVFKSYMLIYVLRQKIHHQVTKWHDLKFCSETRVTSQAMRPDSTSSISLAVKGR